MTSSYTLSGVRSFARDLQNQRDGCGDNGEAMACADLNHTIACQASVCEKLCSAIAEWATQVFTGKIDFDQFTEDLFKEELHQTESEANTWVRLGNEMCSPCYELDALPELQSRLGDIDRLIRNWVRPSRSVAPGPRTVIPDATMSEMKKKIAALSQNRSAVTI